MMLSGCFVSAKSGCEKIVRYTTTHARILIFLVKDSGVIFSYIFCVQFVKIPYESKNDPCSVVKIPRHKQVIVHIKVFNEILYYV